MTRRLSGMPAKKKILRFRRQPNETGLARVAQGARGWQLMYGDERIGSVCPLYGRGGRFSGGPAGWYWYASSNSLGIPLRNTAGEPKGTPEEVKAECREYVAGCLRSAEGGPR